MDILCVRLSFPKARPSSETALKLLFAALSRESDEAMSIFWEVVESRSEELLSKIDDVKLKCQILQCG